MVSSPRTAKVKLSYCSSIRYHPSLHAEPPLHYYFWVNTKKGTLCWSRSNNRRNKREAHVFAVSTTTSHLVSARPDYSPHDLHRFTFWLTTEKGVLNLLAYTEQAYHHWVKELQTLAKQNYVEERDTATARCHGSDEEREEVEGEWTDSSLAIKRVSPEPPHYTTSTSEGMSLPLSPAINPLTSTPHSSSTGQGTPPPLDPYQVM